MKVCIIKNWIIKVEFCHFIANNATHKVHKNQYYTSLLIVHFSDIFQLITFKNMKNALWSIWLFKTFHHHDDEPSKKFLFHFLWLDLYLDLEHKLPNEEDISANFNHIEIQSLWWQNSRIIDFLICVSGFAKWIYLGICSTM